MPRPTSDDGCRCGHPHLAHEHYRRGTDCALCVCARFQVAAAAGQRKPGWLRRLLDAAT